MLLFPILYTVYSSIGPATNTMVRGLDPGLYDTVVRIIGNTGPFILRGRTRPYPVYTTYLVQIDVVPYTT